MKNINRKSASLGSPGIYKMYFNRRRLSAISWIFNAALILLIGLSISVHAETVSEPVIGTVTAKMPGWSPLSIVNITEYPWDVEPRFNSRTKTFFRGPKVGAFIYCIFSPTWNTKMPPPGLPAHYHLWHEWGYTLKGDSTLAEPVSPYQKNGMLYRKRQDGWLSRPAYSLHGGSWESGGGMRAQNPYHLLLFEEGDGSLVTVGPNGVHIKPEWPDSKPDPYDPDWQSVKEFTRPWLVDSANDLEWETDDHVAGRFVKWLSDDLAKGFRAQLVKIPPGWTAPEGTNKTYFQNANRLRYVIYGDMKVWSFDSPESEGKATKVSEDFFIYQPPGSIWGYGKGSVSELGAVWLEVTYAKGLSQGGGPIEEPIALE